MNTTWAVVKIRPEKDSGLYEVWIPDLCDTGAVLYQLSKQANWKLVTMLVPNKPVKYIPTVIEQKPYGASLTKKLKQSDGLPTWCMTECVQKQYLAITTTTLYIWA